MSYFTHPYNYFFPLGLIMIVLSFFTGSRTVDIHVHDTYLVLSFFHILLFIATVFMICGLLYRTLNNYMLSGVLSWIHTGFTIVSLLAIPIIFLIFSSSREHYIDAASSPFQNYRSYGSLAMWSLLIFLFAQGILVINLLGGLVRRMLAA